MVNPFLGAIEKTAAEAGTLAKELVETTVDMSEKLAQTPTTYRSSMLTTAIEREAEIRKAVSKASEIKRWVTGKEINPGFSSLDVKYGNNCGTTSYCLWCRINGLDPEAKALSKSNIPPYSSQMEQITGLSFVDGTTPEKIEQYLKAKGPESNLILGVTRTSGNGHYFNVYYDGRKITVFDAQAGLALDWPHNYGNVKSWGAFVEKKEVELIRP